MNHDNPRKVFHFNQHGRTVTSVAASLECGGVVKLLDGGGTCDEQQCVGRLSGVHRQRRVVNIGRAVPREILDGDHQREALRDIAREVDRAGRLADGGEDGGDFIIVERARWQATNPQA